MAKMAHPNKKLRFTTYNCRSVKNSIIDVKALCLQNDIIFLQEHWLLPFELNFYLVLMMILVSLVRHLLTLVLKFLWAPIWRHCYPVSEVH